MKIPKIHKKFAKNQQKKSKNNEKNLNEKSQKIGKLVSLCFRSTEEYLIFFSFVFSNEIKVC